MEVKDKYSIKMRNIIEDELKEYEIINYLDEESISYLSNRNLFIKDAYEIVKNINEHINKNKKIDINQLKDIINKTIR